MAPTPPTERSGAQPEETFNIGQAAQTSGVSAKMIRYYERIGLMPRVGRTVAGYRRYDEANLHSLRFIRRARDLGFTLKEIAALLGLWRNRRRASADVKRLATQHIAELDARIAEMQAVRQTLQDLACQCHGDERPDCPILEGLAETGERGPGSGGNATRRRL